MRLFFMPEPRPDRPRPRRWRLTAGLVACTVVPALAQPAAEPLRLRLSQAMPAQPQGSGAALPRLSELAERALAAQPLLRGAEAKERADAERVEQARGILRPNVSASLGYQREFADAGSTVPFSNTFGGVRFTVPLYRPQADAGVTQAQRQQEGSRFAVSESQRDVLSRTVEAYLAAAQADEESALLEAERGLLLQQRVLNERRMAGGVGTRVEVMETAARADSLRAQVQGSEGQYRIQVAELRRLAGGAVAGVRRVRETEPPALVPADVEAALAQARERSASLARLGAAVAQARAPIDFQKSGNSPTVDLVGNYNQSHALVSGFPSYTPSTGLGVQLAVPLWTGGINQARVREAHALVEKAEADLKDAEMVLEGELRKAYLDLGRSRQQWQTQVGALEIANEAFAATRKAFDAGVRSNIDLLNSQQFTFSARREALRARIAILLSQARILALIEALNVGTLTRFDAAFGG